MCWWWHNATGLGDLAAKMEPQILLHIYIQTHTYMCLYVVVCIYRLLVVDVVKPIDFRLSTLSAAISLEPGHCLWYRPHQDVVMGPACLSRCHSIRLGELENSHVTVDRKQYP